MGFQHLSQDERKKIAAKGGSRKQTEAIKKAWSIAGTIRAELQSGRKTAGELADEHNISKRMVYRIAKQEGGIE